jgi:serine/threonine protein phosphatase PrpC
MSTAEMRYVQVTGEFSSRPSDEELDLFGITHEGKVRPDNQDHFLVATVHPQVVVHGTSLPRVDELPLRGTRFGTVALVADGVGGADAGSDAARVATEAVARYVASTLRCYHQAGPKDDETFFIALKDAAMQAHDAVRAEAASRPDIRRMATTLTMVVAVWPWMYVTQVGDSRCYLLKNGKLKQLTRDQTVAQNLVDDGSLPADRLAHSPLRHVLASAIGADEATPEVTRWAIDRGTVTLLCSDGLTKHVTDDEIRDQLTKMTSSEQVSRDLLQLALDRGGTDNITILVGRAPLQPRQAFPP